MKLLAAFATMICLTVVANLLLKSGAGAAGTASGNMLGLFNWRIAGGLASFALGAVFYILILTRLPLNVAQSFAALQFVAVVLASWLVLGEPIGAARWAGIGLIGTGILLVGMSVP